MMSATLPTFFARLRDWFRSDDAKRIRAAAVTTAEELGAEVNRAFTEHPATANETYWQHWWFTFRMSCRLIYTGIALLIHGIFPFFFVRTASLQIAYMYGVMRKRMNIAPTTPEDNTGCDI